MRAGLMVALVLVSGCAGEKLALVPSPTVDFSGHWQLNEADSDDPQRVFLAGQNASRSGSAGGQAGQGGQGGQGGRGRGQQSIGNTAPLGPATPAMNALSDGLRWPGKQLEIAQASGTVTIFSQGTKQTYRPGATNASSQSKDTRARDRGDGPAAACGWDGRVLVVQSENPDDEHPPFEERYNLSEDGQRLIEVVAFTGGRSGGFTVSRVWDRVEVKPASAAPAVPGPASGTTGTSGKP